MREVDEQVRTWLHQLVDEAVSAGVYQVTQEATVLELPPLPDERAVMRALTGQHDLRLFWTVDSERQAYEEEVQRRIDVQTSSL